MKMNFYFLIFGFIVGLIIGCYPNQAQETLDDEPVGQFAIYLPADESMIIDTAQLSQIKLSKEPILSIDDIVSYHERTHEFKITTSAVERLNQLDPAGKSFVVTLGSEPIYFGRFMAAYFSMSFDGVVILWPPMNEIEENLHLQLGYPGPDFFEGQDPRSDPRILESLRQAGKLR